jgi:hypothetical protein
MVVPKRPTGPSARIMPKHQENFPLEIRASQRSLRAFEKMGPGLTRKFLGEIADFTRRYEASPNLVAAQYKKLPNLRPEQVLEIDVGGGDRIVAAWKSPVLTILDAGPHEVVPDYESEWLSRDLSNAERLKGFDSRSHDLAFFGQNPDPLVSAYGREAHPDWIYYLADQQAGAAAAIRKAYPRAHPNAPRSFILIGGPGTGKTSVLVKAMLDLKALGATPGLVVTDPVAEQISAGCGIDIEACRIPRDIRGLNLDGFDVLLYDDPPTLGEVEWALTEGFGEARVMVVGFDPCQLEDDVRDQEFEAVRDATDAKVFQLRSCYRQKEALGRASKRVMDSLAKSSPFLHAPKVEGFGDEHELMYRVANDMTFPNPHGYERTYLNAVPNDLRREAARIRRTPLWSHTAPVLLAVDATADVLWDWEKLLKGLSYIDVRFDPDGHWSELLSIKGLEFQHVFLVIGQDLYQVLEKGFRGSGRTVYHARRLVRIPFTRAKDSLVTLVIGEEVPTTEELAKMLQELLNQSRKTANSARL